MKRKWFRKPRFFLVYPLVGLLFITARTTELSLGLGAFIAGLGEALRIWANGYVGHVKVNWTQKWRGDAKIGQLITAGPYAYVRHPLYLGTLLIGLGFCVVVGNWWIGLIALTFFLLIYRWRMAQEEKILSEEWGETFARYQQAVPQWLPTWRTYPNRPHHRALDIFDVKGPGGFASASGRAGCRPPGPPFVIAGAGTRGVIVGATPPLAFARKQGGGAPQGTWSWQGILASKEPKTLVWVVILAILFYLREELIQEGEAFLSHHRVRHLLVFGIMLALMASDGIFELVRRWRRHPAPLHPAPTGRR